MDNLTININKSHAIHKIEDTLNYFCDALYKKNKQIKELEDKLKETENRRVELARAYAKKLNILMTKNRYKKLDKAQKSTTPKKAGHNYR